MESFDRDSECGVGGGGGRTSWGQWPLWWWPPTATMDGPMRRSDGHLGTVSLSLYLGDLTDVTRTCSSLPKLRLTQIGNSPSSLSLSPCCPALLALRSCSLLVVRPAKHSSLPSPLPSYCTLEGNTCPKSHNFPSRPAFLSILQLVGIYKSYAANTPPYKKKNRSFGLLVVRWSCDSYSLGKQNKKSIHTTLTDRHISSRK